MKKHVWIVSLFLIFIILVNDADAQRRRRPSYGRRGGGFNIQELFYSVDFNAGYYVPSMSYWNEESYLVTAGKSFEGGLMYQGGVELKVYEGVLVGLYAGTYSDRVEAYSNIGAIERYEDLVYRITPLSIQAKYQFSLGDPRSRYRNTGISRLHPYLGGGVNYALVTQTLKREFTDPDREDENLRNNGSTITYSGLVGVKYDLTSYFGIGVEMNYYIGGFTQAINVGGGEQTIEDVSLNGPCYNGKIYFKIPQRRGYRRAKRR